MKNTQKILIAILALVFVAVVVLVIIVKSDKGETGTSENSTSYTLPDSTENHEEIITDASQEQNHNHYHDHDHIENTTVPKNNHNTPTTNKSQSSLQNSKKYDLTDAEVVQTRKSSFGEIRLLAAKSNGKNVYLLESTVENKKFYYEFPGSHIIENIYFANVDGRYGDEVIIHAKKSNSYYDNVVLKITPDGMKSLLSTNNAFNLMTGFSSTLKTGFNVEISNKYTNMKKTVNVKGINSENYADSYWDVSGNIVEKEVNDQVWIDETFCTFEPKDVDNDGIYEIVCSQYASLGEYSSCIGYARMTIKYDSASSQFKISDTGFIPHT